MQPRYGKSEEQVDVDLGMLLIRLGLGLMLIAHGWNKLFGQGALNGTIRWFESLGLRPAWIHARLAAITELAAGVMMVAGLLTGLTATAFVGLMAVATLTDHRGKGFFVFKGGCEYTVLVAIVAIAVASLGPGRISGDQDLGLDTAGPAWALAAAVLGPAAAACLLLVSYRPGRQ
jgi:putative oxidoreductase